MSENNGSVKGWGGISQRRACAYPAAACKDIDPYGPVFAVRWSIRDTGAAFYAFFMFWCCYFLFLTCMVSWERRWVIMNLPKFTAEAALYTPTNKYSAMAGRVRNSEGVQPQQYSEPGSGGWTLCRFLLYSCTQLEDKWSCRRWHLECRPD